MLYQTHVSQEDILSIDLQWQYQSKETAKETKFPVLLVR